MHDKKTIDLTGVPQTLLLPLIGRAKLSNKPYSPLNDDKAVDIVNALQYDFDKLLSVKHVKQTLLIWMARAYHFDNAIKNYLKDHPKAVIVNLGCGLDTTFNRVNNGQLSWIDIDFPEVIQLRNELLPPSQQEKYLTGSVLDFNWVDEVKKHGKDVFFFAGGVFMYFTETQVKALFATIEKEFPSAHVIFDNISPKGLQYANEMLQKSGMKDALLQWSVADANELATWSPHIEIIAQFPYFAGIKSQYKFPLTDKFAMYFYDWAHKSGIIHLRFNS